MSSRTILIAHRAAAVRDRFAAALADARHAFVLVDDAPAARRAVAVPGEPVHLALVDLGLAEDAAGFVRALEEAAGPGVPVVVFAGSVRSAREVAALAGTAVAGYISEHAATPQILASLAPHLFPDSFNRRTSPRVAVRLPVSYRAGGVLAAATTLNLSRGGLAIRTLSPVAAGAPIEVRFRLPGTPADIEATGRVAWSDRKVGMGIQFERIDAAALARLDAFVDTQR